MKKKCILLGIVALMLVGCGDSKESIDLSNSMSEGKTSSSVNTPSHTNSVGESELGSTTSATPAKETFLITFNDENGNLLEAKEWEVDLIPYYNYDKEDTAEWDYTFEGWSESLNGSVITIPAVTKSATYYAVISKVKKQYTITFDSNDGTEVPSITDEYGSLIDEPTEPTKDGYSFVSWCTDNTLTTAVTWPITLTENKTYYAKWNETVDIKNYLKTLIDTVGQDPYSYIPNTMRPTNAGNLVTGEEVDYDFTSFTSVNSIKYGGFGEQWQMVMDNIAESERFYTVLTLADSVISSSVVAFNNWFDKNPSDTNKEITETGYYAKVDFSNFVLTYTIQLKTGFTIPLFGEVIPQIDMTYNIITNEKSVRVNLSDSNAMRYLITDNEYLFGIEYGINSVTRSAYCQLTRDVDDNSVQGHIYEYISLKDSDVVKSCADFYINDTYTSVIGNKASGIKLMDGYINELYKTSEGKLLGYKVQETKTIMGVTGTYHTLWFNLNSISGISSVKVTDKSNDNDNSYNTNDIYINGGTSLFTPTYNSKLLVKTSRKYDIELRTQYRYGYENSELTCYKTSIPMMFIQDDNNVDTNYSDFAKDIKAQNGITASVTLSSNYLEKIRDDYDLLIPVFKENKESVNSDIIVDWIGTAVK